MKSSLKSRKTAATRSPHRDENMELEGEDRRRKTQSVDRTVLRARLAERLAEKKARFSEEETTDFIVFRRRPDYFF